MQRKSLSFLHAQDPGKILKAARETLSLSPEELVASLPREARLTAKRYARYEQDPNAAAQISTSLWFCFCELLGLSTDVIMDGYSEQIHLKRVQTAVKQKTFVLPVTATLAKRLKATQQHNEEDPLPAAAARLRLAH